jgi:hypothetical protein
MVMICSLAVDLGRVQLAKTELQRAADAAARAGAAALPGGMASAQAAAISVAAANKVDGTGLVLDSIYDFQVGNWNDTTRTFTPLVGPYQNQSVRAVKIMAKRTAARENAVPCLFGKMFGRGLCDIHASAIAVYSPRNYGIVGLDYINVGGNATNSYNSRKSISPTDRGDIASNGNITLSGSSFINGNAYAGMGKTVFGTNHVTGTSSSLGYTLNYPAGDPGTAKTVNNNNLVPSTALSRGSFKVGNQQRVTLPGGVYYFTNFITGAGSMTTFTGPATVYVTGSIQMNGNAVTSANLPKNLTIVVVPGLTTNSTVLLNGTAGLYATIYAPQSKLTMKGTGDVFGTIVGKSIDMTGNAAVHNDLALGGGIRLVQ